MPKLKSVVGSPGTFEATGASGKPSIVRIECSAGIVRITGAKGTHAFLYTDLAGASRSDAKDRQATLLCSALGEVTGDSFSSAMPEDAELDRMMGLAAARTNPVEVGEDGILRFHAITPEFIASRRAGF